MKKVVLILLIVVVGITINWLSLQMGWWLMTPLVGLVLGLIMRRRALLMACCVGGLGWGIPLAALARSMPVGRISMAVESIIGLNATHGVVVVTLTIVLGCLLSMAGGWIGVAFWQLPGARALMNRI